VSTTMLCARVMNRGRRVGCAARWIRFDVAHGKHVFEPVGFAKPQGQFAARAELWVQRNEASRLNFQLLLTLICHVPRRPRRKPNSSEPRTLPPSAFPSRSDSRMTA
jgi:hypothetical protein